MEDWVDLVAVHHSEQKLNAPQAFKHCKFLFFVFTFVWNDPSGACVLHPMETNFLGVHGRAWARMGAHGWFQSCHRKR